MDTKSVDLKQTINLPRTDFPMKANLPVAEPKMLAAWEAENLYGQIRKSRAGRPTYLLHDGPPYANGNIHLGHAFNKLLKDFIVKSKTMSGFDAPYVPGWDCHGLPIEIKVDQELGSKKAKMTAVEIRTACRKYAAKYVELQKQDFQRLGVFGRWEDPYLTMSAQYQSVIAGAFVDFLDQGLHLQGTQAGQLVPGRSHGAGGSGSRVRGPLQSVDLGSVRADFRSGEDRSGAGRAQSVRADLDHYALDDSRQHGDRVSSAI